MASISDVLLVVLSGVCIYLIILYLKHKSIIKQFYGLESIKADIIRFKNEKDRAQSLLTQIKFELSEYEGSIGRSAKIKNELEDNLKYLKQQVSSAENILDELSLKRNKELERINTLKTEVENLEKQAQKERVKLNKLNQEAVFLTEFKGNKTEFEQEVISLSKSKIELESHLNYLTKQINSAESTLKTVSSMSEAEIKRIKSLETQVETLEKQVQQEQNNLQNLKQKLSSLTEAQGKVTKTKEAKKKENIAELSVKNEVISLYDKPLVNQKFRLVTPDSKDLYPNGEIKYIGYQPNSLFAQTKPYSYPFVSMPKPGSVIKYPRKMVDGRTGKRGIKEAEFDVYLTKYFNKYSGLQFFNDRFLFISDGTHPYEPDHVLIEERNNLNLFIDIEIDEPYDSVSRITLHEEGKDDYRNTYFNDRGWIVVRFAEKQVHQNILGCCKQIAEVIKSVYPEFKIHKDLEDAFSVEQISFWTKARAEKWAKEHEREKYLDTSFPEPVDNSIKGPNLSNLVATEADLKAEVEVVSEHIIFDQSKPYVEFGANPNIENDHIRDSRLKFNEERHLYFIDENPNTTSGTTFIHSFFNDFDAETIAPFVARQKGITVQEVLDGWEEERIKSAQLGTELHSDIENFLLYGECNFDKKEFNYFLDFHRALPRVKLYRTEWRIFDEYLMVAGTVDAIFRKEDGSYAIYDWKRSKGIKKKGYPDYHTKITQKGKSVCADLEDCNYIHYCLQLNLYKRILEEHYLDGVISEMHFVQLHPDKLSYEVFTVPDMQDVIENMYEAYSHISQSSYYTYFSKATQKKSIDSELGKRVNFTPLINNFNKKNECKVLLNPDEVYKNVEVISVVTEKQNGSAIFDELGNKIAIVSFNAVTPCHPKGSVENQDKLTGIVILNKDYLPIKGQYVNIKLAEQKSDGALYVKEILPLPTAKVKFMSFDDL